MESVLLLDNTATLLESHTPDSIPESEEYCNEQLPLTPIPTIKDDTTFIANHDAFLVLQENKPLLPSPPPQEKESIIYNPKKRKAILAANNENGATVNANDDKPPSLMVKEGCKWCQRCGTLETPRWRFGPGGRSSLCNACHLRWKTLGRPADGYSATSFPPPFYNSLPRSRKKGRKCKKAKNDHDDNKEKKLVDIKKKVDKENVKIPSSPPLPILKQETLLPPPAPSATVIIPDVCTICNTTETPLWRKGPLGSKTLCNACGLRWAKGADTIIPIEHKKDVTKTITTKTVTPKRPSNQSLLHQKKEYLQHGLYSIENRIEQQQKPLSPLSKFSFALPIHYGEYILSKQVDFELPPDIHEEREFGLIKGLMTSRQPFFTRIRSNIFVERKPQQNTDEQAICHCVPPTEKDQMGCEEDCLNRMLFYECDPKYCRCGTQCSNQRFQRKERKKGLQVFQTDSRGWGLRTLIDIKKGELVTEYRGEIISHQLCEERMSTTYVNEKNFYFLDYCNGEVIDACTKGTEARFINHSCDPNCHIEKWSLKGESHFGVFASKDIKAKSELFYDYNFSTFNGSVESQQICYCGSQFCRGTIGKKHSVAQQKK